MLRPHRYAHLPIFVTRMIWSSLRHTRESGQVSDQAMWPYFTLT